MKKLKALLPGAIASLALLALINNVPQAKVVKDIVNGNDTGWWG